MKLASFLANAGGQQGTLYIFDEPTTGLHFDDIKKLLAAMNELVERGNTILIIEHNLDVIKTADWIIDLGPEGGDKGGDLLFQGRPEELVEVERSYTAKYLKDKL
jgi:excinuclease ABC subunit A